MVDPSHTGGAAFHPDQWPLLLPMVLNGTALIFAGFIGLAGLRRRSEAMVGLLAATWGGSAVRNLWRLLAGTPAPLTWADWIDFAVHLVLPAMAVHLCLVVRGSATPRRLRWLYGLVTLFLVAALLPPLVPHRFWLRLAGYCGLLVASAVALQRALAHARDLADPTYRRVLHGLVIVWLASALDYLRVLLGWVETLPAALPYAVPIALTISAWALLQRLVRTSAAVQSANAELERRVQQRTMELEAANAAKSRILASASHDLRQPVVTIGLLVDLLRDLSTDERQRAMVERVDSAVASMETLLGGLLDLSRFEAGTVSPRREAVDLQALFAAIESHACEAARVKGLRLRFRTRRLAARSDPLLLEQILRNLVSNALRYTEQGGVLVTARTRRRHVVLQVWDTGIGIPADQQAAVFEEFVQLHNPARERARGMGLGLAIVHRASQLLGHRLWLRSEPGRGSCFSVELPLAPLPVPVAPPLPAGATPLTGLCLALLEDDVAVRAALEDRLSQWGADVWTFGSLHDLKEACEPLHESGSALPWHLLVTDQRLPDGTGLQALEWLRESSPALGGLIITGNTDRTELALLDGAQATVLHKPFRADVLLAAVLSHRWPGKGAAASAPRVDQP